VKPIRFIIPAILIILVGATVVVLLAISHNTPVKQTAQDRSSGQVNSAVPSIVLDGITNNQTLTSDVLMTPTLTSIDKVSKVELYVDNNLAGVSYAAPFKVLLSIAGYSEGIHTVYLKVYTIDGATDVSKTVSVTIMPPAANTTDDTPQATSPSKKTAITPPASGGSTPAAPVIVQNPPTVPSGLTISTNTQNVTSFGWAASTGEVASIDYIVYRDGVLFQTTSSTSITDVTTVPGNSYSYYVVARDSRGLVSSGSVTVTTTLAPTSLWTATDVPGNTDTDPTAIELGMRFRPDTPGKITGVRFYKGAGNTGTHVGSLWDSNGTKLASVTFTGESATGWQEALFSTPVDIIARNVYTVSYTAPNGHLSYDSHYFETAPRNTQFLTGLQTGDGGSNGVYTTTTGTYPTSSFNATNYWVDVVFAPSSGVGSDLKPTVTDLSSVYPGFPGSDNTGVPAGHTLDFYGGTDGVKDGASVVINDKIIYGDFRVVDTASLTITNSKIYGHIDIDSSTASVSISNSEIDSGEWSNATIGFRNITVDHVNVHGGTTAVSCSNTCTVTNSWLHGQFLASGSSAHLGGFLSNGGSTATVTHNTIVCDVPDNASGGGCSGDAQIYGDFDHLSNFTFTNNFFLATPGAYCTSFGYNPAKPYGSDPTNITVQNNIWQKGTSGYCGTVAASTSFLQANGNVWSNNTYNDGSVLGP